MTTDTRLFAGTSPFYARYRPGAPAEVVRYLRGLFSLDGKGRLLDLGCGTGQLTLALARHFEEVVGLDPDADMIHEAQEHVDEESHNVIWKVSRAEDVTDADGTFRLATACRSFHWMDHYSVLAQMERLIEPGGGIAIMGDSSFWRGREDWQRQIRSVLEYVLGPRRRAGSGHFAVTDEPFEDMLVNTGFVEVSVREFAVVRQWTFTDIIGYLHSTSFASVEVLGDKRDQFVQALSAELGFPSASQQFTERANFYVKTAKVGR